MTVGARQKYYITNCNVLIMYNQQSTSSKNNVFNCSEQSKQWTSCYDDKYRRYDVYRWYFIVVSCPYTYILTHVPQYYLSTT